jgi:hypothetical protein
MCAVTLGVFVVIYLSPYDYSNMGSPNVSVTGRRRTLVEPCEIRFGGSVTRHR